MTQHPVMPALPRAQILAERAFLVVERFLHIQALSGILLIVAAAAALLWANGPAADSYHALWHTPVSLGFGDRIVSRSLHFWINDGLMVVFFLVVGMEIRREIHEGALADLRLAVLPLAAAFGGVAVPALIFLALNGDPIARQGWAVPTATDIAFAVGVLTLLGRTVPAAVRVFLLALAIIDDIVAVLIIALFYSNGLAYEGLIVALIGLGLVLGLQRIGVDSAFAYVVPGVVLWVGLLQSGAHPTLAGVALGLMTPVLPARRHERPLDMATRAVQDLGTLAGEPRVDPVRLMKPLRQLWLTQREMMAPVTRVQMALHPWVAFGIMPLFALANAGVRLDGVDLANGAAQQVALGVLLALVIGKPLGVVIASWVAIRFGWAGMPAGMTWSWIGLVGMLAGIGFTMSIFIATLAFADPGLLGAAKVGVLLASLIAAVCGLAYGGFRIRMQRRARLAALASAVFLTALLPLAAGAQAGSGTRALPEAVSCSQCRITIERGAVMAADVLEQRPLQAARDTRGRLYVAQAPPQGLAYLFDSSGRFIRRVGREGSGPGEYREASTPLVSAADTAYLFDLQLLRRTVLSPDGEHVRSAPMTVPTVLNIRLANGLFVASGRGRAPAQTGHPFHVTTDAGEYLRSFGGDGGGPARPGTGPSFRLAPSTGSRFWAANTAAYALDQWDAVSGRRIRSFTRQVPWFPASEVPSDGADGTMPTPAVAGIHEDHDGLVWVMIHVASRNWQNALGAPVDVPQLGRKSYPHRRVDRLYDTIIEVVDPETARVVQSLRVPEYLAFFLGGDNRGVGIYREDSDGLPVLQIGRLQLVR